MAFFNRVFASKNDRNLPSEHCSDRLFLFTAEQVRVVLFRECDFRGRKLLFDSKSVTREPVHDAAKHSKYVEVSNGYGYSCTKPNLDIGQMAEMVFGCVAMSYRGTSFKIHSRNAPSSLMCTQIFPSPKPQQRITSSSAPNQSCVTRAFTSLEQSIKLDDSGVSSAHSISDRSSDTFLGSSSLPLDVPRTYNNNNNNNVGDSGFLLESCNSCNSTSSSFTLSDTQLALSPKFSSGSSYKRWLRSSTMSLDNTSSLATSSSTDECLLRAHSRGSKLGLSIIIELIDVDENLMEQFLMEHIVLIESMVWRARQKVEVAYMRSSSFVSHMFEATLNIKNSILDLLMAPQLNLAAFCDIRCSVSDISFNADLNDQFTKFAKLFTNEWSVREVKKEDWAARRYITDLCELLEEADAKSTNFFVSTLVTAILTHHLGWVATVHASSSPSTLNSTSDERVELRRHPTNPLWGQLADLYGAVGFPSNLARTVITSATNHKLVTRVLNSISYFLRCGKTERQLLTRANIPAQNAHVDVVCRTHACIPKANYKRYEDHLREMEATKSEARTKLSVAAPFADDKKVFEDIELQSMPKARVVEGREAPSSGLKRSKSSVFDVQTDMRHAKGLGTIQEEEQKKKNRKEVIFTLGDDEQLLNINSTGSHCIELTARENGDEEKNEYCQSLFDDADFVKNCDAAACIKPSSSYTALNDALDEMTIGARSSDAHGSGKATFVRAQSEPPESTTKNDVEEQRASKKSRYRYSGVKFNIQQYPQIVHNYMRSKNIEMSQLPFAEKALKLFDEGVASTYQLNGFATDTEMDEDIVETLQTPSNASELEFGNDEILSDKRKETETNGNRAKSKKEADDGMQIVELPMPMGREGLLHTLVHSFNYTSSLVRGVVNHYIPDMVLQGIVAPKCEWEATIRRDLSVTARHPLLDQQIDEAVAIVGNIDTWEVQLLSSNTYVVDPGSLGIRVGMSQLVANMLESLLHMWKRHLPPEYCILHIEQRLQEFCILSKALAELLLATEFCSMETLTSVLHLELNDVPLLMAVASTHSPQVTQKYGISFH